MGNEDITRAAIIETLAAMHADMCNKGVGYWNSAYAVYARADKTRSVSDAFEYAELGYTELGQTPRRGIRGFDELIYELGDRKADDERAVFEFEQSNHFFKEIRELGFRVVIFENYTIGLIANHESGFFGCRYSLLDGFSFDCYIKSTDEEIKKLNDNFVGVYDTLNDEELALGLSRPL